MPSDPSVANPFTATGASQPLVDNDDESEYGNSGDEEDYASRALLRTVEPGIHSLSFSSLISYYPLSLSFSLSLYLNVNICIIRY